MENFLWNLDLSIYKFFNQTLSYDWLDKITPIITDLDHYPWFNYLTVSLVIFFFVKKYKRAGITYFLFLCLAVAMSDFTGGKVKKVFLRPRPFQVAETQTIQKSPAKENRSFYSNHSSNIFTSATYLTAFFPGGKIVLFGIATVIGLSRLHVGVHYPSDVLVGALMGLMWGYLFSRLAKLLIHKMNQRRLKNEKT